MPNATTAEALFEALNVSPVTSLATGGVHRNSAAQGTARPFVVFQFVTGRGTEYTLRRKVSDDHLWQIDAYAEDTEAEEGPLLCDRIMAAVEATLYDAAVPVTGRATLHCRKDMDLPGPSEFDGSVMVHRRSQQWRVEHTDA